ncbi:MAG: hypothetical protein MUE40_15435 [Anaerolineae bacterium]|jgi:hypothetical protein|nr:hypothetical protein [Anaerolineae bacterium]
MQRVTAVVFFIVVVLLLAACQPQAQVLPTLEALPTLPPPSATPAAPVPAAATATPFVRPTLPPTFTPTAEPTATETHTPTPPPTATFFNPPATVPTDCTAFLISDGSRRVEFRAGETPAVAWSAAPAAVRYRITLYDFAGSIIRDDIYIAETFYNFPPELFEPRRNYSWEVYPINAAGDQMCFAQGGELVTVVPPGG